MYDAAVAIGGPGDNRVVYWSRLLDSRNQTLTPNPETIYLMPFFNTTDGPVVLEIPAAEGGSSITGSIDDGWQNALEDVGPAGMDQGTGGRYLILPPGFDAPVPAGYIALPGVTYASFALLRSNLQGGSDGQVVRAVDYGKRIRVYSLSDADDPPPTVFVDAADELFDATIPYTADFFEVLHRFVQAEPWLTRDKAMIDSLRTIGIAKGKAFDPDPATRQLLTEAAQEAHEWLDAAYEAAMLPPFNAGARWSLPASPEVVKGMSTMFADPDSYPLDARAIVYSIAYFSAKHLGSGHGSR